MADTETIIWLLVNHRLVQVISERSSRRTDRLPETTAKNDCVDLENRVKLGLHLRIGNIAGLVVCIFGLKTRNSLLSLPLE